MTDLEDRLAAAPRIRLTGEQLDGLGYGLGSEHGVDFDEWEEYITWSCVESALADAPDGRLRAALEHVRDWLVEYEPDASILDVVVVALAAETPR